MSNSSIEKIALELNNLADSHPIGRLQEIRKELKGLQKLPGRLLFSAKTITDGYAFHHGGRTELQFNIGDDGSGGTKLRHGVAFSFKTSQTLPDISTLKPKVERFNEFLVLFPKLYSDMRMWHWDENDQRSKAAEIGPIPDDLVRKGVFVFLGSMQAITSLSYERILNDFDRLLALYRFVESINGPATSPPAELPAFKFKPGCNQKQTTTTGVQTAATIEIALRHNQIQEALYKRLVSQFGKANVGTENQGFGGTSIDLVVRNGDEYWFYEIKTAQSPRACMREAIGQLLEYSLWPGAQQASKLIVVGESPIDEAGRKYIELLQNQFSLPITYEQQHL